MIEISPENARDYLIERGQIPADGEARIEPLGWGISNVVMKVELPGDCFVFKQSLPKLRVKDDWPFDRSRIFVERDCMRLLGELLPPGRVPSVRFSDDANFTFGMSCAPEGGVLWEQALLEGQIDSHTVEHAGEMLAQMHNRAARDTRAQTRFADPTVFLQGRVDPYHRTTTRVHPDLAPFIEAEVARMLNTRLTLVHGDYSPKNIFAYPEHLFLLDFEVAHYGDPAFDIAFCLNHLLLPAIRFPERCARYLDSMQGLWRSYCGDLDAALSEGIEVHTVRELGCLLLARIDGKSKIPYITEEPTKALARRIARPIITGEETALGAVLELVERRIEEAKQE
jgi:5-methylthioribose kinase